MDVGRLMVRVVPQTPSVPSERPPLASRQAFAYCEALILQERFLLGTPLGRNLIDHVKGRMICANFAGSE